MHAMVLMLACLDPSGHGRRVRMASPPRQRRSKKGHAHIALQSKSHLKVITPLEKLVALLVGLRPAGAWQASGARLRHSLDVNSLIKSLARASFAICMQQDSQRGKKLTRPRSSATTSCIQDFDVQKNPCLARIVQDEALPEYEEGQDFRIVCLESGSERGDLPIFTTSPGAVQLDATGKPPVLRVDVNGVPGVFLLKNILTAQECDQIIKISETFGYTEDAPVSLGRNIRQNENCVWVADDLLCEGLFHRCKAVFPADVQGGEVCGLNARWRLYKYNPMDVFKPHTDGSWPGSGLDASGNLIQDKYGDRWSQLTIVLYLNDDFEGGSTRFFMPTGLANQYRVAEMKAERGGAVCFFHGEHPLSPLHEGGLVSAGTKYIIRTDVLYKLPTGDKDSIQDKWQQHYASIPPRGLTEDMLLEMAKTASSEQRRQIEELLRVMRQDDDSP
mmetsp:Transcript_31595/g.58273  ORF Transcript_31595/g.58273 Transcript_31595/m.58273 type:complete len:446 (-) Transcript_31595:22-1359(-)